MLKKVKSLGIRAMTVDLEKYREGNARILLKLGDLLNNKYAITLNLDSGVMEYQEQSDCMLELRQTSYYQSPIWRQAILASNHIREELKDKKKGTKLDIAELVYDEISGSYHWVEFKHTECYHMEGSSLLDNMLFTGYLGQDLEGFGIIITNESRKSGLNGNHGHGRMIMFACLIK